MCGWTNGCVNVYMMVGVWVHACMHGCGWIGVDGQVCECIISGGYVDG